MATQMTFSLNYVHCFLFCTIYFVVCRANQLHSIPPYSSANDFTLKYSFPFWQLFSCSSIISDCIGLFILHAYTIHLYTCWYIYNGMRTHSARIFNCSCCTATWNVKLKPILWARSHETYYATVGTYLSQIGWNSERRLDGLNLIYYVWFDNFWKEKEMKWKKGN